MKAAAAAQDISTIIRLMNTSSKLTPRDFIDKTLGGLLFMYYMYVDKMHVRPISLDDLIDGLLYIDVKSYLIRDATSSETNHG